MSHSNIYSLRVLTCVLCLFVQRTAFGLPAVFNPHSPQAESIRSLFLLVLAVAAVIFVLVAGAATAFMFRYRHRAGDPDTEPPQIYGSQPIELAWTLGPFLTVLVLALVVVRSVVQARPEAPHDNDLGIRVVGHQWWWEVEYPEQGFTTANEVVLPVSNVDAPEPTHVQLESADVIHSFWVPRLNGKTDLIPGRVNSMWLEPKRAKIYHGQCAEFCGTQHAHMLLTVKAVSTDEFAQWVANQQEPAVEDPAVAEGRQRFMSLACADCHRIRGTAANGEFAPDLTHLMSRGTIVAGLLENSRDNLVAWVSNPQAIKTGSRMPDMRLEHEDVEKIVDFLETLK